MDWPRQAKSPYLAILRRGQWGFGPLHDVIEGDNALFLSLDMERHFRDFPETWTFTFYNSKSPNLLEMDTVMSFGALETTNEERVKVLVRPILSVLHEASRTGTLNILLRDIHEPQLLKFPYTVEKDIELYSALLDARNYIPHEHHSAEELVSLFLNRPYPLQSLNAETMTVYHLAGDDIIADSGVRYEDADD